MSGERVVFECALPPVALRRNSETAHKGYRAKLVREYAEQVWCAAMDETRSQLPRNRRWGWNGKPWARASLRLTWRHHRAAPDPDNALASCKVLIDVCKSTGPRPLGIFRDDSPDCLHIEPMVVEKVRTKAEECVVVSIERRE